MSPGGGMNTAWITLAFALLIVVRFLFRELRERTVRLRTLWIRPVLLAVLMLVMIAGAVAAPGANLALLTGSVIAGAALGVLTGVLVVRSTSFAPANVRGAVRVRGSMTTVIVWVVAIALRLVARFALIGSAGGTSGAAGIAAQFELNAGLLALITAAFIVVALAFHRAIDRLAPAPG